MRFALLLVIAAGCRPPGYGEGDGAPDAGRDAAGHDAAEAPDAAADAGPDAPPVTCEAMFRLEGYGTAQSVWLTGDFVEWAGTPEAGAVVMTLGDDAAWTGARTFDAGAYVYKFIVDGAQWIADPANPEQLDDGFGGVNSVYRCE